MPKAKKIEEKDMVEDTSAPAPSKSKTENIASVVNALAMLSPDKVNEIAASLATSVEESAEETEAEDKTKLALKEAIEADLVEAFGDEKLSDEMRVKLSTLFESALSTRLNMEVETLNEHFADLVEEQVAARVDELTDKINDYITRAAEEWITENEVAVESALRTEISESLLESLRDVLIAHNIDVPEDKIDMVEELEARIAHLEGELNEAIEDNIEMAKELTEARQHQILDTVTEGLNQYEAHKFRTLMEDISAESEDEFIQKAAIIKEKHFPKAKAVKSELLTEQIDEIDLPETKSTSAPMQKYVAAMSRISVKTK